MLDQLRQIAVFARTVEHGSFRKAAAALRLSPSVVSHHVAQLEERLGVALIYRTTRRLSVTREGAELFSAAREMLSAIEGGLAKISDAAEAPSGELRVTAPAFLAQSDLVDRISAFASLYPRVRLNMDFTDERRHILKDGFDIAIRAGWLEDSQMKARKLAEVERRMICAPSYLADRDLPTTPEDVEKWDWVFLSSVRPELTFNHGNGETRRIRVEPRLTMNSVYAMYRLVEAGAGVAVLPNHMSDAAIKAGRTTPLLPDWHPLPIGTYAVWPPNAPRQGLVGKFVDALVAKPASESMQR